MRFFRLRTPQEELDHLCQDGENLLQKGRAEQAEAKFEAALKVDETSFRAHAGKGRALYNQWINLEKEVQAGLAEGGYALDKKRVELFHLMGEQVMAEMEQGLKMSVQSAEFCAEMGDVFFRFSRFEDAVRMFLRTLQLNPKQGIIYYQLALCYIEQKLYPEAIDALQHAADLLLEKPEIYFQLGLAYYNNDQIDKSVTAYQTAIFLKPDYADALYNLGTAFIALDKRAAAVDAYRKFIALEPFSPDTYQLRSMFPELI